jgi:hypothetical protein
LDPTQKKFDRRNGIGCYRIGRNGNVETSETETGRNFEFAENSEFVDRCSERSESNFCNTIGSQDAAQSFETLGSYLPDFLDELKPLLLVWK